jgi:hypothetical protein
MFMGTNSSDNRHDHEGEKMSDISQGPGWWQAADGKWYPPQPTAPKKRFYARVWFWLLVIVALGFAGCIAVVGSATNAINKADTTKHTVVYAVTGDGSADITYDTFTNGNSGSSQVSGAPLPWTKTITGSGLFSIYGVSADIESGTTATCTITVDGKVVAHNTATGQFASADCNATS